MERVPTLKEDLKRVTSENPGHLIASTACLGSESSIHLLAIREAELNNDTEKLNYHRSKLNEFFTYCIDVFGKDNFFVELQPAISDEQIYVNQKLIPIADYYGLKRIITTDTHYARPEDRAIHSAYLNSKEGDRETASFYQDCYAHTVEEIFEKMDYIDRSIVEDAINNTLLINDMVEDYTIEHEIVIPKIDLPEFKVRHLFERGYEKYTYIQKMAHSDNEQDQFLIKLIEDGFEEKLCGNTLSRESFHEILKRLDDELGELWEISKSLNQSMPSYYITVREIINIIWEDDECGGNSLVGVARGSAAGFLVNYLLDITQINPITYNLPHWRHLHKSRPDYY
jgi:DNA polymerase-3 subunit alpha